MKDNTNYINGETPRLAFSGENNFYQYRNADATTIIIKYVK